jgi:FMN phosphatase YigB (HAD superfamily)
MGLPAEAMLFIDDWPPHVQTALAAGFQGAVLDRNAKAPAIPGLTYLNASWESVRVSVDDGRVDS